MRKFARSLTLVGFLIALAFDLVAAQNVTQAERDAIRSACRSDFISNCSGVEPGGREALECLRQNDAKLSAPCKSAVATLTQKPEPGTGESAATTPKSPAVETAAQTSQTQDDQLKKIRQACTIDDLMAHCSWIAPSSPEVVLCLKANAAELSPSCRGAVGSSSTATSPPAQGETTRHEQVAVPPRKVEPAATTEAPAPSPSAAANRKPTSQQRNAIRAACRSDFMSHCSGVQPGGSQALQCLQRNAARLSPSCKRAVAAIAETTIPSASAQPSEDTAAPAVAPLGPMPALRPRAALAILRICGPEMRQLCGGTAGGGRIISCLAENASSLSPECYRALAAARSY
jgi:hypothetical protein